MEMGKLTRLKTTFLFCIGLIILASHKNLLLVKGFSTESTGFDVETTAETGVVSSDSSDSTEPPATVNTAGVVTETTATETTAAETDSTVTTLPSEPSTVEEWTTLITTQPPEVPEPKDLVVDGETEYTLNISWSAPDDTAPGDYEAFHLNCTGADLELQDYLDDSHTVQKIPGQDRYSQECVNLTAGALYNVTVYSVQNGLYSWPIAQLAVTVPLKPTVDVNPISADALAVHLSYPEGPVAHCTEFHISWELTNDGDTHENSTEISCVDTVYNISGVPSDGQYEVNVFTVSNYTEEEDEDLSQISVDSGNDTEFTFPDPVRDLVLASHTVSSLEVNWTRPERSANIYSYTLLVEQSEDKSDCVEVTLTPEGEGQLSSPSLHNQQCNQTNGTYDPSEKEVSYTVTGLEVWTQYDLTAWGTNPAGDSIREEILGVYTDQDKPGQVSALQSSTNSSALRLTWSEPDEPNGIITQYNVCWTAMDGYCEWECEANTTKQCSTVANSTTEWTKTELCPYRSFDFTVAACNSKECGEVISGSNATAEDVPSAPSDIEVINNSHSNFEVRWQIGDCKTGNTSYTLLVVDEDDGTTFSHTVYGFDQNSATLVDQDLTAYWWYQVSVMSATGVGTANGSLDSSVRTAEDAPGPVQSAEAEPVEDECYHMKVEWKEPTERDRHGIILGYHVYIEKPDGENGKTSFSNDTRIGMVDVNPNNESYIFKVVAETSAGEGEPEFTERKLSGTCAPLRPDDENQSLITKPLGSCQNCDKTKQFAIQIDQDGITNDTNGALSHSGFIVAQITDGSDIENDGVLDYVSLEDMNGDYGPWSAAKESDPMPAYRATADNWTPPSRGQQKRALRAGPINEVVGGDKDCEGQGEYCNGYVRSGAKYRVRAFTCTAGGCLVTAYSAADQYFETASPPSSNGWIFGLVFGLVAIMLIIVLLMFGYLRYRREQWPFDKSGDATGDGYKMTPIDKNRPVSLSVFAEHCDALHKDSDLGFAKEYKDVQNLSSDSGTTAAELPDCRLKNRYVNILPFDHSRVKLLPVDDEEGSDYINANYMVGYNSKREFIASQGPIDSTIDDFWRMIWEQNVPMIVMLTRLVERGRVKCAQYWPDDNEPLYYGDLQVQMRSESTLDHYTIRIFDVRLGEMCRTIPQYHYTSWPDFGCPDTTDALLGLVKIIRAEIRPSFAGPIMVHCSAGVGRTGTFVCVDRLLQHIREFDQVDIFNMVLEMRSYRANMVQTEDQYIYIHDCLKDALERGMHLEQDNPALDKEGEEDENLYENTRPYKTSLI